MQFTIATLLSQLSEDKLVAPKLLEKKLDCHTDIDVERLQIALDALERVGVIEKDRGKYRRLGLDDVVEAKLRCSSKGFCFAIQDCEDAEDIYVRESQLGSAWNSDRVLVRVTKEASRRRSPEGEVMVILERSNASLLAQVKHTPEKGYRAVPLDDRLLFELELQQDEATLKDAVDKLVHVEVRRYPLGSSLPIGEVTRVLGSDAEEAADVDIVCCKHDLPRTFPERVLAAVEDLPTELSEAELKGRRDCRDLLTLTFSDPVASSEADPPPVEVAYTLEKSEAGAWKLGIHTADVAHFIGLDSPLDKEARRRGTAVNLIDLVLPLFPPAASERFALLPDCDRPAVSLFLTIDETGQVAEFEFQPTVIRVDTQLAYQQAQSLLGQTGGGETAEIAAMLDGLFFQLSPLVKSQRLQRGAFDLELPLRRPCFSDEGRLGAIATAAELPVRALLCELVLLAGKALAAHLQALGLAALYRVQAAPKPNEVEDIVKLGNNLDLEMTLESEEEVTPQDFQNWVQKFGQSSAPRLLCYLLKGTLKPVKYGTHPSLYFGLADTEGYVPCTSPGSRYGDLLMQHILKAVFTDGRDRRHSRTKEGVNLGSSGCHGKINWNVLPTATTNDFDERVRAILYALNDRDKLAQDAETDLEGLKKAEQMKERTGQVFQGLITGVQSYGFFVEVEDLLLEGLVHVSSLKDDWYEYRARHACLVGRKNRIAYRLGSRVKVQVKSVDYYRQQIDLITVLEEADATDVEHFIPEGEDE